jgi:hypothetical protein
MANLMTRVLGKEVAPSPTTLWAVRLGLWIAASVVGLTGVMIWLDLVMETLFLDEAVIWGATAFLMWLVAKIKGTIRGGWAWVTMAGALLFGQSWMVFFDLTLPTLFFDEVAYLLINSSMAGIIYKLRGKARAQSQED